MHYKRHKWLDTEKNLTESELVKLALSKIELDPSQFDVFIDMLRDTAGMSWVVGKITGGELICIYYRVLPPLHCSYAIEIFEPREVLLGLK